MQLFLRLLKISVLKTLQISKRASIWECFLNIIFIILEKQCLEWLGGLQLCLKITSTWLFSWKFAKFSKQLFNGTNLFIVIFLRLLIIFFANFIHAQNFQGMHRYYETFHTLRKYKTHKVVFLSDQNFGQQDMQRDCCQELFSKLRCSGNLIYILKVLTLLKKSF